MTIVAYAAQDFLIEMEKISGDAYFKAFLQTLGKNSVNEFESYKVNFKNQDFIYPFGVSEKSFKENQQIYSSKIAKRGQDKHDFSNKKCNF